MEDQNGINDDATPFDIFDAAQESGTLMETESAEQQEETTEATTEATESTEESTNSTEEISTTDDTEEATEATEEATEVESPDSDIIDLNVDDNAEQPNDTQQEATDQTIDTDFERFLGGQFDDEADLEQHLIDMQTRIEELEGAKPEFANDYVAKLNEHVLNGGSATQFTRVQGVDTDNMNAVELLTTELMWNNPDLSREDAVSYLERKFSDSLDDEGNLNPNDAFLKVDAGKAAKAIKEIQAKDTLVPQGGMSEEEWSEKTTAQQKEAQETQHQQNMARMEEWMQPVEDELDNLKKNGLIVPLTDDKGFRFPFNGDAAYEEKLIEKVDNTLMQMGTSIKESPKAAKELMELHFKNDNFDAIVKAASVKGANSMNEEWFKKVHNPSVIARGDAAPAAAKSVPTAEEAMKKVMGM